MTKLFPRLAVPFATLVFAFSLSAAPHAKHVFIISMDGGKPASIEKSKMPALKSMVKEGSHTWTANTIFPSKTLPSHVSMLTGVGPDKHKILWNGWTPSNGVVRVTTVFTEAKKAGYSTAMFVGKEKFRHLMQPNTVDQFGYNVAASGIVTKEDEGQKELMKEGTVLSKTVSADAAAYIVKEKPNLCFIHLTDADSAGHKFGWESAEQKKALASVDKGIATVLHAIREAGIENDSVILVSADHGGHSKAHGTASAEDMNIPWIAWGTGVKKNFTITTPVTTYDTAATALWLLDVPVPASFDGRPVTAAFN